MVAIFHVAWWDGYVCSKALVTTRGVPVLPSICFVNSCWGRSIALPASRVDGWLPESRVDACTRVAISMQETHPYTFDYCI
jgi:hypothetical protein